MATAKGKAAFEHMVTTLKRNKKATFAEVAAAAKKAGHTIYPIMYGRAQALLGIVKTRARRKKAFLAAAASKVGDALSNAGRRLGRSTAGGRNSHAIRGGDGSSNGLPVDSGDLAAAQSLIDALHAGRRPALHYRSGSWVISAD